MGGYLQKTVRVIKHTYGMQGDTMNHFHLYFVPMGRVQQKCFLFHFLTLCSMDTRASVELLNFKS